MCSNFIEELILNIEEEKMAFVTIKLHKMCILILCGNFVQEVKKKIWVMTAELMKWLFSGNLT